MPDPRLSRLARVLVDYSIDVQPNERVAISAPTLAAPLVEAVFLRVLERGGFPHLLLALPGLDSLFLQRASDAQLDYVSPLLQTAYGEFEGLVSLSAPANTRELSGVDPEKQGRRRKAMAPLSELILKRAAQGKYKWVGANFPVNALAQDAEMSLAEYEDFVYGACHVNGDDDPTAHWLGVRDTQQKLVDWLAPHDKVEIRGPNVDLRLSVKGRTFINACGRRNMPDGEIFTSPVEDSVEGWVRFSFPAVIYGRAVEGVELKFEAGRVVQAAAAKNEDFLLSCLDTDAGARVLGEFAIGTNFGIARFSRNVLFDEKIGGTIHLAVGAGFPDAGGLNRSGLHWDMVTDMRPDGQILVDGELLYEGGQFKV
jgi:aminopeptidase